MKHCILAVLLLCAVAISVGQDKPTGFRADLLGQMEYVQKQIMDLENAIPDKKMSWRPDAKHIPHPASGIPRLTPRRSRTVPSARSSPTRGAE